MSHRNAPMVTRPYVYACDRRFGRGARRFRRTERDLPARPHPSVTPVGSGGTVPRDDRRSPPVVGMDGGNRAYRVRRSPAEPVGRTCRPGPSDRALTPEAATRFDPRSTLVNIQTRGRGQPANRSPPSPGADRHAPVPPGPRGTVDVRIVKERWHVRGLLISHGDSTA